MSSVPPHHKNEKKLRRGPMSQAELFAYREMVSDLVQKDPAKAAIILVDWINQPAKKSTLRKTA